MKRALVLGGGGSKGAYQTGSYKALLELGFSFDLVVGVSIGSLNAALIVQDEFDKLENLWNSVELNGIIKNGLNLTYDMDYYFDNKASILPLLKTYAENKGMDIAPLVNLVKNNIDFKKLTESSIDFGLLSVEVPNLAPHEITKKDLTQNNYDKWVLARDGEKALSDKVEPYIKRDARKRKNKNTTGNQFRFNSLCQPNQTKPNQTKG